MYLSPATIPYFEQPSLDLGFMELYAWGTLVAVGFLVGTKLASNWSSKFGGNPVLVYDYAMWAFLGGFGGAHIFHALFYAPAEMRDNPLYLFYFWDGFSSFGGFFGAALATIFFFRRRPERFIDYADALSLGLVPGWAIGRIGCFLAQDHPGIESNFFLAVENRYGVPHHDLGLYDSLLSWGITIVLLILVRQNPRRGIIGGWMCILYALGRAPLDHLRIIDERYFGLTPAQYSCAVLFVFGVFLLQWAKRTEPVFPSPGEGTSEEEEA